MTDKERLMDAGYEDVVVFENPSYDGAVIGVSCDGRAVYDYNKMVVSAMIEEGWNKDDAVDWIDYNAIGSIRYVGSIDGNPPPIIMYPLYDEEDTDGQHDG